MVDSDAAFCYELIYLIWVANQWTFLENIPLSMDGGWWLVSNNLFDASRKDEHQI